MIAGEHTFIRMAEPDDTPALHTLYALDRPRSALLDKKREPLMPARDELREMLGRKESATQGTLFAVEDRTGLVRGFCGLRALPPETPFAETSLLFLDEDDIASPLGEEAWAFLEHRAFVHKRLFKVITHCLARELALRAFLLDHGFASRGVQRQVLFAAGNWHDLETLALYAAQGTAPCPS